MSKVDTAWLRMESATNPMMITGVLVLVRQLPLDALKEVVQTRFMSYPRLCQRVLDLGAQAFWEPDPDFDLDAHVQLLRLPANAGHAALEHCVSTLASTPLKSGRPLWQFHLIEHYAGGSAVVVRIHHCYADGMALVGVMLSLTDPDADYHRARKHGKHAKTDPGILGRWWESSRHGIEQVGGLLEGARKTAVEFTQHPQTVAESLAGKAQEGLRGIGEIVRELGHALTLPDDPDTALKGSLSRHKRVAWCPPLPLDEVKLVGRALCATVNDVLLACAAGALRQFLLKSQPDLAADLKIRASVPVNLRPAHKARELGNQFGLVFVDLPVGEAHPIARVAAVAASMRELKHSKQAIVTYGLLSALGMAPAYVQKPAFELLSRKASLVATNVPGPPAPLFLAGVAVPQMMFWVPQTGSIGVGISILSYAGNVYFGLIADADLIAEPAAVAKAFAAELDKLVLFTLMCDGPELPAPPSPGEADTNLRAFAAVRPKSVKASAPVQGRRSKVKA